MKIKDINNKFTSFIQKIEITTIDKLDINKPKFKEVDVFFPSYYQNEDKYICTEFTCQFENDNDKVTLNMNKKVYNSRYSIFFTYFSIFSIHFYLKSPWIEDKPVDKFFHLLSLKFYFVQ